MSRIEERARKIVREAYFDYKLDREHSTYAIYQNKMDMLKDLFPKSTNQDTLENVWNAMWRKQY